MRLTPETADALVNSLAARVAGGSIVLYTGPRPADMVLLFQRRLAGFAFPDPAFWGADAGTALSHDLPLAMIEATGKAVWAQLLDATGVLVADASVGTEGGSEDILLDQTTLTKDGTVRLTRVALTLPL